MNPADPGLQARVEVQMLEAQQFQGATATSTNAQAPDEKKMATKGATSLAGVNVSTMLKKKHISSPNRFKS